MTLEKKIGEPKKFKQLFKKPTIIETIRLNRLH